MLLVGHCSADGPQITKLLEANFDAKVDHARTFDATISAVSTKSYDLIIINRLLDETGESGLDLIATIKKKDKPPTMMLVSNYPDAQEEAIKLGASPGFGKRNLNTRSTVDIIRGALAS